MSTDPNSGATAVNCGDGFEHAPVVLASSNTFIAPTGATTSTASFPVANGVVPNPGDPGNSGEFWVCFRATVPFTDITGSTAASSTNSSGQTVYTGLLPMCNPFNPGNGPCINSIVISAGDTTVTEKITYPAADATFTDPQWF